MKNLPIVRNHTMIKYHNNLNLVTLKDFTAREMNIFLTMCSIMRDEGIKDVEISFQDIKTVTGSVFRKEEEFIKTLRTTNRKFLKFTCGFTTKDGKLVDFVLFPTFEIDPNKKVLKVAVNSKFSYILNEITKNFTVFELQEFSSLKSTYSKNLFRFLKQYKSTGVYRVSVEEFRRLMDIPESYDMRKIGSYVFSNINKELPLYFEDFKIHKIKEGRLIKYFEFTFKPQVSDTTGKVIDVEPEQESPVQEAEIILCPHCHKELQYICSSGHCFYGHKDYKTAACHKTFSTLEDVKAEEARLSEIERRKAEAKKQQEADLRKTQEAAFKFLEKQTEYRADPEDVTEEDFKKLCEENSFLFEFKGVVSPGGLKKVFINDKRSGGNISYEVNHESFKKFRILVEKAISEL